MKSTEEERRLDEKETETETEKRLRGREEKSVLQHRTFVSRDSER